MMGFEVIESIIFACRGNFVGGMVYPMFGSTCIYTYFLLMFSFILTLPIPFSFYNI